MASLFEKDVLKSSAADLPAWIDLDFPLQAASEGQRLLVQDVASIEQQAALRIGMVKGDRYTEGRLLTLLVQARPGWIKTWRPWLTGCVATKTRSKFLSLWHSMTSDFGIGRRRWRRRLSH